MRRNKFSKHGINVIAIKDNIYHMRKILSTYVQHRKSSSERSHGNRQQTIWKSLTGEQHRYKMQIQMEPHLVFTPSTPLHPLSGGAPMLPLGNEQCTKTYWGRAWWIETDGVGCWQYNNTELHFLSILKWERAENRKVWRTRGKKEQWLKISEQKDQLWQPDGNMLGKHFCIIIIIIIKR